MEPQLKTLPDDVKATTRPEAMERAIHTIRKTLSALFGTIDMNHSDAAHGTGHVVFDPNK